MFSIASAFGVNCRRLNVSAPDDPPELRRVKHESFRLLDECHRSRPKRRSEPVEAVRRGDYARVTEDCRHGHNGAERQRPSDEAFEKPMSHRRLTESFLSILSADCQHDEAPVFRSVSRNTSRRPTPRHLTSRLASCRSSLLGGKKRIRPSPGAVVGQEVADPPAPSRHDATRRQRYAGRYRRRGSLFRWLKAAPTLYRRRPASNVDEPKTFISRRHPPPMANSSRSSGESTKNRVSIGTRRFGDKVSLLSIASRCPHNAAGSASVSTGADEEEASSVPKRCAESTTSTIMRQESVAAPSNHPSAARRQPEAAVSGFLASMGFVCLVFGAQYARGWLDRRRRSETEPRRNRRVAAVVPNPVANIGFLIHAT